MTPCIYTYEILKVIAIIREIAGTRQIDDFTRLYPTN